MRKLKLGNGLRTSETLGEGESGAAVSIVCVPAWAHS